MVKYRLKFRKFGETRFVSHLDLVRLFTRLHTRAGLPLAYSEGFNPHPKMAIALLSEFTADRILLLIASGDSKSLTAASGVGNKLAQRIVLELKDKVGTNFAVGGSAEIANIGNATVRTNTKEAIDRRNLLFCR